MSRPFYGCALIATIAAGLLSAGCTPSRTTPGRATAPPVVGPSPGAGPVLSGTVSISGAASIPATTFTVGAQVEVGRLQETPAPGASCADYAKGLSGGAQGVDGVGFAAPMLQTSGYHNIYVGVSMPSGYRGPGTYDNAHDPSLTGTAVEGIGSGSAAVFTVFHAKDAGTITLTVHADGSGSLNIVHWDSDEVRQAPGASQVDINGLVTWTCSD